MVISTVPLLPALTMPASFNAPALTTASVSSAVSAEIVPMAFLVPNSETAPWIEPALVSTPAVNVPDAA